MLNSVKKALVRKKIKQRNKDTKPRVVVFRSNKNFYAQLICSKTGNVFVQCSTKSKSFIEEGKGSMLSGMAKSELLGRKFAEMCVKKGFKMAVFDRGCYYYSGRVRSFADSCRSSGMIF